MWYADDASAGAPYRVSMLGGITHLVRLGPDYGYFPNAVKTCLIVKPQYLRKARVLFLGTGVVITDSGRGHLGSAFGY